MLHRWQVNEFFNFDTPLGAVFDLHGGHEFTQKKREISSIQEKTRLDLELVFPDEAASIHTPQSGLNSKIKRDLRKQPRTSREKP